MTHTLVVYLGGAFVSFCCMLWGAAKSPLLPGFLGLVAAVVCAALWPYFVCVTAWGRFAKGDWAL